MDGTEFLEYLDECFIAKFDTGELFWKERPASHFKTEQACKTWNTRFSGKLAGTNHGDYKKICLKGHPHLLHRIMYMIYNQKVLDESQILDHINGRKSDNRPVNLREVTRSQNGMNRGNQINNTSGYSGISWDKSRNRWEVHIKINGRKIHLGRFDGLPEAIEARKFAEEEYFGDYKYSVRYNKGT